MKDFVNVVAGLLLIALVMVLVYAGFKIAEWFLDRRDKKKRERLEAFAPIVEKELEQKEKQREYFGKVTKQNLVKEKIQKLQEDTHFLPAQVKKERYQEIEALKEEYWALEQSINVLHGEYIKVNQQIREIYQNFEEFEKRKS